MWSRDVLMSMVTKLVRVVTHHDNLPPRNLQDPSIMWDCEVTRQIKYVISSVAVDLCLYQSRQGVDLQWIVFTLKVT